MHIRLSHKFFLDLNKTFKDGFKIYLRITVNRKKNEMYTGYGCTVQEWDEHKERQKGKGDSYINQELCKLEAKIYAAKDQLVFEKQIVTAQSIKAVLTGVSSFDVSLLDYFDKHIDQICNLKSDFAPSTVKTYRTAYKHLKKFLISIDKTQITVKNIDYQIIADFDYYLRTVVKKIRGESLHNNTVVKQHSKLRTILLKAIKEGYITQTPYKDFPLKIKEREVPELSEDELDKIKNLHLYERLDRVRDVFLFSCYTGLRFSDASALKISDIKQDREGDYWLKVKEQEKTEKPVSVPMFKEAINIVNKYNESSERKILGLVLPKITNQKTNAYLKEIAALANIDNHLTHKVSRHTFATTVLSNNEISEKLIAHYLGHASTRSTKIYTKIRPKLLKSIMRKIDGNGLGS